MITCLHCRAETSNGLALCDLCQRKLRLDLEFLPVYFRNLARWRPGRAGSRQVPGSRVLWSGERSEDSSGDRISDRLDEAHNALVTWALLLTEARPHFVRPLTVTDAALWGDLPLDLTTDQPQVVAWLCAGFDEHLTSIATTDWAGELVRDLGRHEDTLRRLTEALIPGWYAGGCKGCDGGIYVVPGLTWVTCQGCGATMAARDRLEVILTEARGWVARPMRIAEALVALIDTEQSVTRLHKRISKWGERGQVEALRRPDADGDPTGPKRYRLGEVLDLLLREGQTRTATSERIGA